MYTIVQCSIAANLGGAGEDGFTRREVDARAHLLVRGVNAVQQLLCEREARARARVDRAHHPHLLAVSMISTCVQLYIHICIYTYTYVYMFL